MTEQPVAASPGPDRFLAGIVGGAVLLIIVSILVVVMSGRGAPPAPPAPDSPAGVVQTYIEAIRRGDLDQARGLLSRSARAELSSDQYRERFGSYSTAADTERRILIEPTEVGADQAQVKITISTFSAGPEPFSASTYHRDVTVYLVKEDDAWRISQPYEPYALLD